MAFLSDNLSLFASTPPGLEHITSRELTRLDIQGAKMEAGGVSFSGDLATLYRVNLWSRTAGRILIRLDGFFVVHLAKLHKKLLRIPWEKILNPEIPVSVRATCRKSRIYHSVAAAERCAKAIHERLGLDTLPEYGEGAPRESDGTDTVVLRLERDHCTVSLDSSGEHLHRRGYRTGRYEAPLRENLAAALLLGLGYDGSVAFWDPMCGSGTLPIEAAMIAANIPPGLSRRFSFMNWPEFNADLWEGMVEKARRDICVPGVVIGGSDVSDDAVTLSLQHAASTDAAQFTRFETVAVADLEAPMSRGLIATNPPYGKRIGDRRQLRRLYHQLGTAVVRHSGELQLGIVTPEASFVDATGLDMRPVGPPFPNGGIRVSLYSTIA